MIDWASVASAAPTSTAPAAEAANSGAIPTEARWCGSIDWATLVVAGFGESVPAHNEATEANEPTGAQKPPAYPDGEEAPPDAHDDFADVIEGFL
ncbi:MAG: hypothetical protein WCJ64_13235 [Rhodospirillaceae bacterium]